MISGIYAALFALMQVFLTLRIVKARSINKVSLGDGGHEELMRKIRGHGNFVETVPMVLILMLIAELSGAPLWCIHVLGLLMIAARAMHYIGMTKGTRHRVHGVQLTVLVFVLGALLCLWLAWPTLLAA